MQFWALLIDSIRESLDRKIFWVMLTITLLVVLAMASISFENDEVSILFGLWETEAGHFNPLSPVGRSALLGGVIYYVMSFFLGWVGLILTLIATAGFFPTMLERGVVDVLLSKPISRPRLFLYKYLCSMVFVLIQSTIFVVLTFLVMGWRWGVWAPGYLASIPLMVLLFSYVYCISVLVAVKTRSVVAAVLISIGAWVMYACPKVAVDTFNQYPSLKEHRQLYDAVRVLAWIPPKTGDVRYLAARWAEAGTSLDVLPQEVMGRSASELKQIERANELEQQELLKNPFLSIGSSLLFEGVILLWAMAGPIRRDY